MTDQPERPPVEEGDRVVDFVGNPCGRVVGVLSNLIVVRRGIIFSTDQYVPWRFVGGMVDQSVSLTISKHQFLNLGPEDLEEPEEVSEHVVVL